MLTYLCRASVGAVIFVTIYVAKSTVILPASIGAAAMEAGLPASSVADVVKGLLTMNTTLAKAAPGMTPSILAAAVAGELDGCAHLRFQLQELLTESSLPTDSNSFHFGWYASIPFIAAGALLAVGLDGSAIKRQMSWVVDNPVRLSRHFTQYPV